MPPRPMTRRIEKSPIVSPVRSAPAAGRGSALVGAMLPDDGGVTGWVASSIDRLPPPASPSSVQQPCDRQGVTGGIPVTSVHRLPVRAEANRADGRVQLMDAKRLPA